MRALLERLLPTEFIERRGRETGAWRGEIEHGEVKQRKVS